MRGAAVFDLDGTLIPTSAERRLIRLLRENHVIGPRQMISAALRALTHVYSREAMTVRNKAIWRGVREVELLEAAFELFAGKAPGQIAAPLLGLVDEHRAAGRMLVLLSGTPEPALGLFARELGFDLYRGTRLEVNGGMLTGRIDGLHPYGVRKLRIWRELAGEHELSPEDSFAYADRLPDRFLLEAVGHPTAVNPDTKLARLARKRSWPILRAW